MRGAPVRDHLYGLSFAGRNSEMEQPPTLYLQARHVLIGGPPKIGKTEGKSEGRVYTKHKEHIRWSKRRRYSLFKNPGRPKPFA